MAAPRPSRTLRLGVAGLGRAFTIMLPTLAEDDRIALVAAADPRAEARARFAEDFRARTYATVEELCADPEIDVIYVATPHQLHAQHVRAATAAKKHVIVEKPLAVMLADCRAMIDAARKANVHLIVGHSHSFDAPYRRAREIIAGGALGKLGMITAFNFTDFMYRPRRPEELITEQGGGVIFSQGAHQIDIIRLLGGSRLRSVRAATGTWDPARPAEGAYSALLTFADGAFATAVYSGYGHFDSDEFSGWIGEMGLPKDRSRYGEARRSLSGVNAEQEAMLKAARNYGGSAYKPPAAAGAHLHQQFGLLLASCQHGDLRPTAEGVMIYGDSEQRLEKVAVPSVPRAEVIDELYDAVVHGRAPLHSGEWAMATLEVCLAILRSAKEQRDVTLEHQTGLPA
ncbi:MAG: Gfo/Idh/MocA family oxidoreductase [Xanthobacteraceae bacterium]